MFLARIDRLSVRYENPDGNIERIISEDIFQALLKAALKSIEVDEDWYMETYQDVKQAWRAKEISSAAEHFVRYGYFEGRLPRNIEVDEDYYLASNPDVAAAVRNNQIPSGRAHFEATGYKEGRLPSDGFSLFPGV
jgi:hypothetical protein